MDYKSLLKNSAVAVASQLVVLFASIVTTLGLPKVLGITQFGYWQLFIFYTSYTGFFHLGLTDGVFLITGGKTRSEVDKRRLNSQFWFGLSYESLFSFMIIIAAFFAYTNIDRKFVLAATAIFVIINNAGYYLGFLFQAMNETRLYSFSMIIDRALFLLPLCVLLILHVNNFLYYIAFYMFSKCVSLIFCIYNARDFFAAGFEKLTSLLPSSFRTMAIGIKLTLANTAGMLVVGIARYSIDRNWGIDVFGKVSFSLSLINFILFSVQQISMVFFPALRQVSKKEQATIYGNTQELIDIVAPYIYLLYYPALLIVTFWLPQYLDSMKYFAILLPICIFDAKMEMGCSTVLKVQRKELLLLFINVLTVLVSLVLTLISTICFNSLEITLFFCVLVIIMRSLITELIVSKMLVVKFNPLSLLDIALSGIFIALSLFLPLQHSVISYSFILVLCFPFSFNKILSLLNGHPVYKTI